MEMTSRGLRARRANSAAAFSRTASVALLGWPELNGGRGSYSIINCAISAASRPAISANSSRARSSPAETPAAVHILPDLTTRWSGTAVAPKTTERGQRPPMGRCAAPIEEAGGGKNERARAHGRGHRACLGRPLQPCEQSSVCHCRHGVGFRARREHQERMRRLLERVRCANDESAAVGHDRTRLMSHQSDL
jgi:hypothetical protein